MFLLYSHLFPVSCQSEGMSVMSKHWKRFIKLCFEMFRMAHKVNMKIVMEHCNL